MVVSESAQTTPKIQQSCSFRNMERERKKLLSGLSKRKQSKLMHDEDYVEAISAIVKRDFFPDLEDITHKNSETFTDPQHPVSQIHTEWENEIQGRLSVSNEVKPGHRERIKEKLGGLDEFFFSHESEDNVSFSQLLDLQNSIKRQRNARHYRRNNVTTQISKVRDENGTRRVGHTLRNNLMFDPDSTFDQDKTFEKLGKRIAYANMRTCSEHNNPRPLSFNRQVASRNSNNLPPLVNGHGFVLSTETSGKSRNFSDRTKSSAVNSKLTTAGNALLQKFAHKDT